MPEPASDVLIAGGGFAGLALACALRQSLGPSFRVAVADPAFARPPSDARASAIAAGARRLFETIGVWAAVADDTQPILDMVITDSKLDDAVRPTFLTFGGEIAPGEPFAHMVENTPLLAALVERAAQGGVVLLPTSLTEFSSRSPSAHRRITAELGNGQAHATRLLVAADGAHSRVRAGAGITCTSWAYPQSAIVTTVAHERPPRPCRRALSSRRPIRDPPAEGLALIDRLDRRGS